MLNAGFDVGNGYLKALLKDPVADDRAAEEEARAKGIRLDEDAPVRARPDAVDMPSAVAILANSDSMKVSGDSAIESEMDRLYDRLEVSFATPLVAEAEEGQTVYIGHRAVGSNNSVREFQMHGGMRLKSENELSAMLVLSVTAAKALKNYYRDHGHMLPAPGETVMADAQIAMSVPIEEYKTKRDDVPPKYMESTHTVYVHNFQQGPIRVDIQITNMQVQAEGASAHFAVASKILTNGHAFMERLVARMTKLSGNKLPEGITPEIVEGAMNIIGVDIGEGTVNFPVYQDFHLNTDTSSTLIKGYGDVLDKAMETLVKQKGFSFTTRKHFADWFIKAKDRPMQQAKYKVAQKVVNDNIDNFTEEVANKFSAILEVNGANTEVIYVYGGGATPVAESLMPKLCRAVDRTVGDSSNMPILYLDSDYSRTLNRDGLYLIASNNCEKDAANDLTALYSL